MSDYPVPYSATQSEIEVDTSGRHPVNVLHLVMGVAFLGLAAIWALTDSESIGSDELRWFLPLPWLAAGLAGLLAVALTGRRSRDQHSPAAAQVEPEETVL